MQSLVPRVIVIIEFGAERDNTRSLRTQQPNGGNAKYFGNKFNFPCACHFGCGFSMLWLLAVISPNRKTANFAANLTVIRSHKS